MADSHQREHYIPIRQRELVEALAHDKGWNPEEASQFRQVASLLASIFHFEYHRTLEELKDDYAPFDPDGITVPLLPLDAKERAGRLSAFFDRFGQLMERGNFQHLDKAAIEEATRVVSDWGLNMDVDFSIFERMDVYFRGDTVGQRTRRKWYRFFRKESIDLPVFQRLVLLVKLKSSDRLPSGVDTEDVFIKLFKDIPKMDVEMLLPGARMIMPGFSRLKMGGSFVGGLLYVLYTVIKHIVTTGFALSLYFFWAPLVALFGYGYRQYYGYTTTKNAFTLQLTQSLYYQTLGNNLGVVQHLLDETEEQEGRETILGYFFLLRRAPEQGWTGQELDEAIERELKERWNVSVDFEIADALHKLERLGLVHRTEDRYLAAPLADALTRLDETWDNYFRYHNERMEPAMRAVDSSAESP